MAQCSLITPAFSCEYSDPESYYHLCASNLGVNFQDIELYALVPLKDYPNPSQIAIMIRQSTFSMYSFEEILKERDILKIQVDKTREALISYSERLLAQAEKSGPNEEKYKRKITKLSEDNKKLRQLLKYLLFRTQLENAENLRIETQKTVENLRQEFDMLVKELMAAKEGKTRLEERPPNEKRFVVPKLKI